MTWLIWLKNVVRYATSKNSRLPVDTKIEPASDSDNFWQNGMYGVSVGYHALKYVSIGNDNVAIGYCALGSKYNSDMVIFLDELGVA